MGKVGASGGTKTDGGNVYHSPEESGSAPRSSSNKSDNVVTMKTGPGDNLGMGHVSSHNDINAFTRGIKSRGPYGGPSFASLDNAKATYQRDNTSATSVFKNPSGGSTSRGTAGGSGRGMTSSRKVGSGSAKMTTRQSSPKSNKDGSGYMASNG